MLDGVGGLHFFFVLLYSACSGMAYLFYSFSLSCFGLRSVGPFAAVWWRRVFYPGVMDPLIRSRLIYFSVRYGLRLRLGGSPFVVLVLFLGAFLLFLGCLGC